MWLVEGRRGCELGQEVVSRACAVVAAAGRCLTSMEPVDDGGVGGDGNG